MFKAKWYSNLEKKVVVVKDIEYIKKYRLDG